MMIVTRRALHRRTFLRGMGATIALPLLDAMVPAFTATARAASPVRRLAFFYVPNGILPEYFHPAGTGGIDFDLTPVLAPMEPFRKHMTVVTGLSNRGVMNPSSEAAGPHIRPHGGWLSGTLIKRTEGSDIRGAKTIDQYAADTLGAETPLRSLELTLESSFEVGGCENGYSCAYRNSTSWLTPTTPLPHERDPRVLFDRIFGDGGTASTRLARMRTDRSILDSVTASISRLSRRLGPSDRWMVTGYFDAVRDVERRIQRAAAHNAASPLPTMEPPSSVPEQFEDHMKLMFDLLALAFQADVTRVSCMQLSRELSGRAYPQIGVPEGHHEVSHHQMNAHSKEQYKKICAYWVSLFTHFVDKLRQTPDGDGTLLDHSISLYGAGLGDGDHHSPLNLPVLLMGHGCGTLEGGRHLVYPMDTPFMNLGLTLLEKVDAPVAAIGDSTGVLTGI